MADLIAPNSNDPQEMAKQVEAIAEAAAQHDEQVAQLLNLVPKAAALSTAASRAINFTKKDWVDTPTSGTPITAADMNRIEQAIVDLNTTLTSVQNSLSQIVVEAPLKEVKFGLVGDGTSWIQLTTQSGEKYLLQAQKNKEVGFGFFKWNEGVSNWDTIGITSWK